MTTYNEIAEARNKLVLLQKEEKHHAHISAYGLQACTKCPSKNICKKLSVELADLETAFLAGKKPNV